MNRAIKQLFALSLGLALSACASDQKFKVQFEPTLPVPYLIVPDEGAQNNPTNPNDGYRKNAPPRLNQDHPQDDHRHGNDTHGGDTNPPQYEDDAQPDYPYGY